MAESHHGRRALLIAAALAPLAAVTGQAQTRYALTAQDTADLARIQTYLNGLKTLKAQFLQLAPNGATARGTAWLDRPGRMRFQYDPPSPLLLVAGHGLVVFHDSQLNQTSNIPLGQTPLGILLRDNVSFGGDITVSGIQRQPGMIQVTIYQTARPGDGTLTLNFANNPLALRQWTVVDAQHRETRVSLYDIALGGTFDQSLFTFVDPKFYQNNDEH
jgi:outer membrane lipoprotein-sorting protein